MRAYCVKTFSPEENTPLGIILPQQVHGINIVEIKTGKEDISNADGVWTKDFSLSLGVVTADCAPICFWSTEKFGIIHVGWKGLVRGLCEEMLKIFPNSNQFDVRTQVWIGAFLPYFEIKKDDCYTQLKKKFGTAFFDEIDGKIFFNFRMAILSIFPTAQLDGRNTMLDPALASWRGDQTKKRNTTVIGKCLTFDDHCSWTKVV